MFCFRTASRKDDGAISEGILYKAFKVMFQQLLSGNKLELMVCNYVAGVVCSIFDEEESSSLHVCNFLCVVMLVACCVAPY